MACIACKPHCPLHKNQHIPYLIVVIDCTHVGSASASFKDFMIVAKKLSTNQTADVLVENQLQPPLVLITVFQAGEHKPNSRNEHGKSFFHIMQHVCGLYSIIS